MTDPIIPPYPADARETCSTVAPSDAAAEVVAESLPFVVEAPEPNAPLPGIAPAMRRVDGGYVREDAHPGVGEAKARVCADPGHGDPGHACIIDYDAPSTSEEVRALRLTANIHRGQCPENIASYVRALDKAHAERDSLREEMAEVRSREEKLRTAKFLLEQEFQQRDASESLGAFERKMGKPLGNPDVYVVPVGVMCEALAALRADLSPPRPRAGEPPAPASTGTGGEEAKRISCGKGCGASVPADGHLTYFECNNCPWGGEKTCCRYHAIGGAPKRSCSVPRAQVTP